jgi:hypothetical protein
MDMEHASRGAPHGVILPVHGAEEEFGPLPPLPPPDLQYRVVEEFQGIVTLLGSPQLRPARIPVVGRRFCQIPAVFLGSLVGSASLAA